MVKILHVDNEQDTIVLVKLILTKAGYNVESAMSGKECLKKYEEEKPNLILLDIMMPDMSGWDVFQKIREKNKKQKIAFLSVIEVSEQRKAELMKEGLVDYILKPFTEEELKTRVKKILGEKK